MCRKSGLSKQSVGDCAASVEKIEVEKREPKFVPVGRRVWTSPRLNSSICRLTLLGFGDM